MSDIKMSDVFELPIFNNSHTYESGESISIISDNYCNEIVSNDADLTKSEVDYICEAVNNYDTMQARIVELEKAISGILNSPHTKLTKGALLEVSEVDIDAAIKALEK